MTRRPGRCRPPLRAKTRWSAVARDRRSPLFNGARTTSDRGTWTLLDFARVVLPRRVRPRLRLDAAIHCSVPPGAQGAHARPATASTPGRRWCGRELPTTAVEHAALRKQQVDAQTNAFPDRASHQYLGAGKMSPFRCCSPRNYQDWTITSRSGAHHPPHWGACMVPGVVGAAAEQRSARGQTREHH